MAEEAGLKGGAACGEGVRAGVAAGVEHGTEGGDDIVLQQVPEDHKTVQALFHLFESQSIHILT